VDWEVFVTKQAGDARRYAEEAAAAGYDAVAAYGGDGTVMEVATGLLGSAVPLAIFPGGTANVMSVELGIPSDTSEACALVSDRESALRSVDMGRCGDHYFILRVGIGFEADMVEGADRELKNKIGQLAYAVSAVQALREPTVARYHMTIDGQAVESEGITCIVANSGSLGSSGLSLSPKIDPGDGLLDVVVVRKADLASLVSVAASIVAGKEDAGPMQRWQGRQIHVAMDPPQTVTVDGEIVEMNPLDIAVVPRAVQVIVPKSARAAGSE
jgi:YegS/Rv2252/BmrU family lipid kinase